MRPVCLMTVSCIPNIYLSLFFSFFFFSKFDNHYSIIGVFSFFFVCVVAFCVRVCTSIGLSLPPSLSLSLSHTHTQQMVMWQSGGRLETKLDWTRSW